MKKNKWIGRKAILIFAGCFLLSGCQGKENSQVTTQEEESSSLKFLDWITETTKAEKEVDWTEENFSQENVLIFYPIFSPEENSSNLSEKKELFEKINKQVREDALRILEYFDVNLESDTLDITYEIADITKDWISIVYCGNYSRIGAAYPVAVCYTSNLSLKDGSHLRAAQMKESAVLVKQIQEGNYRIIEEEEEQKNAVKEELSRFTEEELTKALECADFGAECYESYPEYFSFWSTIEGETQISLVIPVQHVLGDYAILEFLSEES